MNAVKLLFTCIGSLLFLHCFADECTSYVEESNWQRSTANILDPKSQAAFCDIGMRSRWYRFTSRAGSTIPDSCPPVFACGTTGSIWARGTLPKTVGTIANLTACVKVQGSCCASSWTISAKKCKSKAEEYYVYFLQRPPGCMYYCAGTEKPCPPGSNSPNGFTPGCTKNFPTIDKGPSVYPASKNNRIMFLCEFKSEDNSKHSEFEVTWYQGTPARQLKKMTILTGAERVATIQNTNQYPNDPLFFLGTTISCRVRTWFAYSKNRTSAYFESNSYFAGITVEPKQLNFNVKEGKGPLKLTVKATVPIVCEKSPHGCQVLVDLGQDNSQNFLDLCTLIFKTGPANQTKSVEVYAKSDFVNDGNRMMLLKTDVLEHIDPVDWNQHLRIPDVKITAEDVSTAQCTTTGDPHLRTFDGLSYNHYQVGDYLLVNSSCRRFEVHVRTWKCGSVSCNCGIAAREGDDVIVVDMCRDKIPRARFASTTEPAAGTSVRRDNNGKSFIISFPSGATIRIDTHKWFANWYYANFNLQVPSDDFECTKGLCGTFDGNRKNELTDKNGKRWTAYGKGGTSPAFTESWKLPVGESLFYYKGDKKKCTATRAKYFCTCKEQPGHRPQVNCGFTSIVNKPKYIQGTKGWKDLNFPGGKHCGKRRRRATSEDEIILPDDNQLVDYVYDPDPLKNITIPDWPTPSGKTYNFVKRHCEEAVMNSKPGKVCKKIGDFEFKPFVDQCIDDIQITDNMTFSLSAIRTMQDSCEEIFLKNMTFWEADPAQNNTFSPPTDLGNTLCPNLCSGRGRCVNASCICEKGFISADCSIEAKKGPTVVSIIGHGLCNIRKGTGCLKVRVNGYDFLDSQNLSCHVKELKISDQPYKVTNNEYILKGVLLSFREVMCELKTHPVKIDRQKGGSAGVPYAGYQLRVSNNGIKYSNNSALYVIHDGHCMDCRPSKGICKIKPGSCYINGYCYQRGENNPWKICSKCLPDQSQSEFSEDTKGNCSKSTKRPIKTTEMKTEKPTKMPDEKSSKVSTNQEGSKTVIIIICSVVGAVLLIALVATVFFKSKNKERKGDKIPDVATPGVSHKHYDAKTFVNASYEPQCD